MGRGSLQASSEGIEKAKKELEYCGLTQKALGEELGIARSTISNFFNNKKVDRWVFEEICFRLNLDWEEIFEKPSVYQEKPKRENQSQKSEKKSYSALIPETVDNNSDSISNKAIEEYRQVVQEYLRKYQTLEGYLLKFLLQQKAQELQLSKAQARKIEQAEKNKIHQNQDRVEQAKKQYQNLLNKTITEGKYPFNSATEKLLKQAQDYLELTDEIVVEISQAILTQAEVDYQISNQIDSFKVITVDEKGTETNKKNKKARFFKEKLSNGVELEMVAIPGGEFLMGTEEVEIERLVQKFAREDFRREKPQHRVKIKPFFLGKYLITQAQWQAIMVENPAKFTDNLLNPVERVSWYDAVEFCQRLSQHTGREYRLPSEAEWEYAARAGTASPFYFGETITAVLANYNASYTYAKETQGNYREKTTPVGSFTPNSFGLYDMHGNVWEWCEDDWHENYIDARTDNSAWLTEANIKKVIRGGSWSIFPFKCRSAFRGRNSSDNRVNYLGFRVVCITSTTT